MDIYINGELISDIIAFQGFHQKRKNVNGRNGGVNLLGDTILDLLNRKIQADFKCLPISPARYRLLLQQLSPKTITVDFSDRDGNVSKLMFASSDLDADYDKSTGFWTDAQFSLEEL